jgi:hypothetical protein
MYQYQTSTSCIMNNLKTPTKKGNILDKMRLNAKASEETRPESVSTSSSASPLDCVLVGGIDLPDYIAPNLHDMMLSDLTSLSLHVVVSAELDTAYLAAATEKQVSPLVGLILGPNKRPMVNVATKRRSLGDVIYPAINVIFLIDTGVPYTYICEEAMKVLLGPCSGNNIPQQMYVELADFPFVVEAYISPLTSHFRDVNVIGMDVLCQIKTNIGGCSSFTLSTVQKNSK